jgi:hypothetical protein
MADAADSELRRLDAAYRTAANELEAARKIEASNPPIIRADQYGHKEIMQSDALRKAELGYRVAFDKIQKFYHTPDGEDARDRRNKINERAEELKGLFGGRRHRTAKRSGRKTGKKARKMRMLKSRRRY